MSSRTKIRSTRASRALRALLEEGGDIADAIRADVHRTMLWRFSTGRGKPDADTIAKLHRMSDGRILAEGWGDDEDVKEVA